eukprot:1190252-Prorocentrum_minimum.AAC.3
MEPLTVTQSILKANGIPTVHLDILNKTLPWNQAPGSKGASCLRCQSELWESHWPSIFIVSLSTAPFAGA